MSFPSRSSCSSNGVLTLSSICDASNTLPFSVASPTANTLATPCPSITLDPRITWLVWNVASESNSSSITDLSASGSPVSVDSSTLNEVASSSSASAGISSPVLRMIISPTTISLRGTVVTLPSFRITCTGSSSLTWLRIENSLSALYSNMNASPVARSMAIMIPNGSKKTFSPSPRYQYS